MAGLKCKTASCGFAMPVPDRAVPELMKDSATITCPKCNVEQPAGDAWVAWEQMDSLVRHGPPTFFGFGGTGIEVSRQRIITPGR